MVRHLSFIYKSCTSSSHTSCICSLTICDKLLHFVSSPSNLFNSPCPNLIAEFYWKHLGAAHQIRAIDFSAIPFCGVPSHHSLEGGGGCQETLIFSDFSVIYSSFPSIPFCCTYLYYFSTTSTIISKHCVDFPFASFAFSPSPSDRLYFTYL